MFETLPLPELTAEMRELGQRLDAPAGGDAGAGDGTDPTYNLVHDPVVTDADIAGLRGFPTGTDDPVARAYGWGDLLEENHRRYAQEAAQLLHTKKSAKPSNASPPRTDGVPMGQMGVDAAPRSVAG